MPGTSTWVNSCPSRIEYLIISNIVEFVFHQRVDIFRKGLQEQLYILHLLLSHNICCWFRPFLVPYSPVISTILPLISLFATNSFVFITNQQSFGTSWNSSPISSSTLWQSSVLCTVIYIQRDSRRNLQRLQTGLGLFWHDRGIGHGADSSCVASNCKIHRPCQGRKVITTSSCWM